MNILIIAAHPDDEVLGMGGTMLRHAKENDTVNVMYLATGITSRKNDSLVTKNSDYKRIQESGSASVKRTYRVNESMDIMSLIPFLETKTVWHPKGK